MFGCIVYFVVDVYVLVLFVVRVWFFDCLLVCLIARLRVCSWFGECLFVWIVGCFVLCVYLRVCVGFVVFVRGVACVVRLLVCVFGCVLDFVFVCLCCVVVF